MGTVRLFPDPVPSSRRRDIEPVLEIRPLPLQMHGAFLEVADVEEGALAGAWLLRFTEGHLQGIAHGDGVLQLGPIQHAEHAVQVRVENASLTSAPDIEAPVGVSTAIREHEPLVDLVGVIGFPSRSTITAPHVSRCIALEVLRDPHEDIPHRLLEELVPLHENVGQGAFDVR